MSAPSGPLDPSMDHVDWVKTERLKAYARLRGGWPIPLAGGLWWLGLAVLGTQFDGVTWGGIAFFLTGAIFPLALVIARLANIPFMQDKAPLQGVLFPAFAAMMLFWPMAIGALWEAPGLVPLILAIGLSLHWPVIGWSYGRLWPYLSHAVIRAMASFAVWHLFPEERFVAIPLVVAGVYFITVASLVVDSGAVKARLLRGASSSY